MAPLKIKKQAPDGPLDYLDLLCQLIEVPPGSPQQDIETACIAFATRVEGRAPVQLSATIPRVSAVLPAIRNAFASERVRASLGISREEWSTYENR